MDKTIKNKSRNVYIVTGGILTENIITFLKHDNSLIIGVDKGSKWLVDHNIIPDYFVGDFDSVDQSFFMDIKNKYPDRVHISLPEKDETDTELAMRLAIQLNPKTIKIFGGIGSRLDHVIANIHILLQAEKEGISSYLEGSSNRIQLALPNQIKKMEKSKFTYISLIPLSEKVEGINGKGFKFPLYDRTMEVGIPFGISNELIENNGAITIKTGILLIIESKD